MTPKRPLITEFDFNVNVQPPMKKGEVRSVSCMPQVPFRPTGFDVPSGLRGKFLVRDVRVGVTSMMVDGLNPVPLEGFVGMQLEMKDTIPGIMVTLVVECIAPEPTPFEGAKLLGKEIEFEYPSPLERIGRGSVTRITNRLRLIADEIDLLFRDP